MASTDPLIPQFTAGDRYRKAREKAELSQEQLADEIGISVRTVSRYETDQITNPRRIVVRQWALRTGVPADWLAPALFKLRGNSTPRHRKGRGGTHPGFNTPGGDQFRHIVITRIEAA